MKMGKEIIEKVHKFDIDLSKKEYAAFRDYGLEQIKKDDSALINYAINKILSDSINKRK